MQTVLKRYTIRIPDMEYFPDIFFPGIFNLKPDASRSPFHFRNSSWFVLPQTSENRVA